MRIIAYNYDADTHCVDCAQNRFAVGHAIHGLDSNNIPLKARDSEGNLVHPVFSTDEQLEPLYCGDCRKEIEPANQSSDAGAPTQ